MKGRMRATRADAVGRIKSGVCTLFQCGTCGSTPGRHAPRSIQRRRQNTVHDAAPRKRPRLMHPTRFLFIAGYASEPIVSELISPYTCLMRAQPIYGFGIGGYKSFSGAPQLVGPFKKINIFIGENNSGKSNVLRFIRDVYHPIASKQSSVKPVSGTSLPQGGEYSEFVPILLPATDDYIKTLRANLEPYEISAIKLILSADATDDSCIILFSPSRNSIYFDVEKIASRVSNDGRHYIQRAWAKVTNRGSGDLKVHWIPELIEWYFKSSLQSPPTLHYVPTLRQIPTKLEEFDKEYGGSLKLQR